MIRAPSKIIGDQDTDLEIQELLDEPFRKLVDEAATAGWAPPEVLNALDELVRNYRVAYEIDPDPAEDRLPGIQVIATISGPSRQTTAWSKHS